MTERPTLGLGLMSGTSLDGMDAALTRFTGPTHAELLGFATRPYSDAERDAIRAVLGGGSARDFARLHARLAEWACEAQVFNLGLVQVPEGRQLFAKMTVEENLLMGAYRRSDKAAVRRTLVEVYELFPQLAERARQIAGSLSGGEQQMCGMARALMAAPKLLAVDEMSLGLAPIIVDRLLKVLGEIRARGVTVLLVEQDVFAAFSVADRGYVLETGRIVQEGRVADLERDPALRKAYLGVA